MRGALIYESHETLAELVEQRMDLRVTCCGCGCCGQSAWHKLPRRLPRDTPVRLLGVHFRCKQCGSRKIHCRRIVTKYWAYVR